ncbi:hypothetical protein, partial [Sphingobacterium sp.]|uniref:hypothetical protein n=1 Tax=Sphingobacterium sp. TaxID=341027 RepID=UPI00289EB318
IDTQELLSEKRPRDPYYSRLHGKGAPMLRYKVVAGLLAAQYPDIHNKRKADSILQILFST